MYYLRIRFYFIFLSRILKGTAEIQRWRVVEARPFGAKILFEMCVRTIRKGSGAQEMSSLRKRSLQRAHSKGCRGFLRGFCLNKSLETFREVLFRSSRWINPTISYQRSCKVVDHSREFLLRRAVFVFRKMSGIIGNMQADSVRSRSYESINTKVTSLTGKRDFSLRLLL